MSSSQLITHTYLAQREAVAEGAFFHTHLIQHSATCTFHSNRLKVLHHLLTILQLTWAQKPPQTEESACFTWTRSVLCTKIRDLPEQTSDGFSNIYLWIFTRGEKFCGENLQKCWPALFNSLHLIVAINMVANNGRNLLLRECDPPTRHEEKKNNFRLF